MTGYIMSIFSGICLKNHYKLGRHVDISIRMTPGWTSPWGMYDTPLNLQMVCKTQDNTGLLWWRKFEDIQYMGIWLSFAFSRFLYMVIFLSALFPEARFIPRRCTTLWRTMCIDHIVHFTPNVHRPGCSHFMYYFSQNNT